MSTKNRSFWFQKVESVWRHNPIIWLSGVRRSGKSALIENLPRVEYMDCTLPSARRALERPLDLLNDIGEGRLAIDEIHRLVNPFEVIQIAAQYYKQIQLIVSSAVPLASTANPAQTEIPEGKIHDLWLTPMMSSDVVDFQEFDLYHRFLRGGLPSFYLSASYPERGFQDWMDEYWVNDVQYLYKIERRNSFEKFAELLFVNSGEIFEATKYADPCQVSRTTISSYLAVLEKTYAAHVLKPFTSRRSSEIIAAPRVYAFDTGFVAHHRGWKDLRETDLDPLWKHFVLNELHATMQTRAFYYWKDKRNHEVDFVFARRIHTPTAIVCSWANSKFDPTGLVSFRRQYPAGNNYVVCHDVFQPFTKSYRQLTVKFVPLSSLVSELLA